MLLNSQQTFYAIKNQGQIISKHGSKNEAEMQLINLKNSNGSLYESANITMLTEDGKELLFG